MSTKIHHNTKRANRRKWIKALRSGKFKQTRGAIARRLRTEAEKYTWESEPTKIATCPSDGTSFCCLGLAAKVCDLKDNVNSAEGKLLSTSLDLLGLSCDQQSRLISLNDHAKYSFKKIADVVEKLPIV